MKKPAENLIETSRAYFVDGSTMTAESPIAPETQIIVAAVLCHEGRFLLVEEAIDGLPVLNQPAGRIELNERAVDGVAREAWEESGVRFSPDHLIGIYEWHSARHNKRYLRLAFTGPVTDFGDCKPKDPTILRTLWLSPAEIAAQATRLRSPFIMACIEDYLASRRFPIDLIRQFEPR